MRIPVSVSATGVVVHDGHPYSMPPDAIGLPGTLYLLRDRVRIIAGRSTLPEHRAERVAAVSGKRARRYLQRQHLLEFGPPALRYLTELMHHRPRTWITRSRGSIPCCRHTAEQAIGAEYIAHYLGTPMPPLPFDEPEDRPSTISASLLPRGGRS